jgi:signal peptidase II
MSLWSAIASRRYYFMLASGVLALDQITKILAHAYLRERGALEVIPGVFNLWYSRNPGGLFGYFRDWGDPWRSLLLTLLPLAAVVLIAVFMVRDHHAGRAMRLALALILGGATGNLIDRLLRGEVIDFLDVYASSQWLADRLVAWFGTAHWPTFNMADSAIVTGACLLMLTTLTSPKSSTADGSGNLPAADARPPV